MSQANNGAHPWGETKLSQHKVTEIADVTLEHLSQAAFETAAAQLREAAAEKDPIAFVKRAAGVLVKSGMKAVLPL